MADPRVASVRARLLSLELSHAREGISALAGLALTEAELGCVPFLLEVVTQGSTDEEKLRSAIVRVSAQKAADAVCDMTTCLALSLLGRGDVEQAVSVARRASRMARTEAIRSCEAFAAITLARARRLSGRPYLALRILRTVREMGDKDILPWLAWEEVLASGVSSESGGYGATLSLLLSSARSGDRDAYAAKAEALFRALSGLPHLAADLSALLAVLDPDAMTEDVRAWKVGDENVVARGLQGLLGERDEDRSTAMVVVLRPGVRPARILSLGLPLLGQEATLSLARMARKKGRTEVALAALALAGSDGLSEHGLFERAYGFPYVEALHRGVLDVLIHRVRRHAEGILTIERRGQVWVAGPPCSLVVLHDPRSVPSDDERVLQLIAKRGALTPQETARTLGLPLRTAQALLEGLAKSGTCIALKHGRGLQYTVEDTTFEEPTDLVPQKS